MTVEDLALEIIEKLTVGNVRGCIMIDAVDLDSKNGVVDLDSKHGVIELIKMLKKLDGEP